MAHHGTMEAHHGAMEANNGAVVSVMRVITIDFLAQIPLSQNIRFVEALLRRIFPSD
jgi:hypothetical protein